LDAEELLKFVHGWRIPTLQSLGGDPLRETISGVFTERNVVVAASTTFGLTPPHSNIPPTPSPPTLTGWRSLF